MFLFLKIFNEAAKQALDSLWTNKMRTFLSLLGITIGIFCIIAVKSAVDSLEKNIVDGFKELGNDVIYVEKNPWNEDPNQNWWKYQKRPNPSYEDFQAIQKKSKLTSSAAYVVFTGGRTIKHKNSAVSNAFIMGPTYDYERLQAMKIEKGRSFTMSEYLAGGNKLVLGHKVAESLFGSLDPLGKDVKIFGQSFQVLGVLQPEGDNSFNILNFDDVIWVPYPTITRFVNTNDESTAGKMLCIKAREGIAMSDFKGEITGIVRSARKLPPREDDNFSINEITQVTEMLSSVFKVMNVAGGIIGLFSLLVGMFSVANIMFVSVKERTNLIGIKKAIGAKSSVVLTEFLIESVILCIIGGAMGLLMVILVLKIISSVQSFQMSTSLNNIIFGVSISIIVGIIAGIIPAIKASKMDPVEAMRG